MIRNPENFTVRNATLGRWPGYESMGLFRKATVLTSVVLIVSAVSLVALNVTGAPSTQQEVADAQEIAPDEPGSGSRIHAGVSAGLKPPPVRAKFDKGSPFAKGCGLARTNGRVVACQYGPKNSKTSIALFGDSHAVQYSPAFVTLAKRRGWNVVTYMRGDCVVANVNYKPACNKWRRGAIKKIAAQKPDLIVVSNSTADRFQVKRGGRKLNRKASEKFLRKGMARTYRRLLRIRSGKGRPARVTLLRDQALAPFRPPDCLKKNPNRPGRCSFRIKRPNPPGFDWVAAKRVPKVRIVQPMKRFCGKKRCPAVEGNIVIYRDRYHLTATYARTLASWLAARIGV